MGRLTKLPEPDLSGGPYESQVPDPPRMAELIYATQPNWIIDLVAALEEHEDTHRCVKDGGLCFQAQLDRVPTNVRTAARAVAEYRRQEARANG